MTTAVLPPFPIFFDSSGVPLSDGFVYIGRPNENPECSAISIYWDYDLQIPAAQPIRTLNGYYSRSGSPASVYTNGDSVDYSITVRDKNGALVYTSLTNTRLPPAFDGIGNTIVDTIADLRAVDSTELIVCLVSGYNSQGDGGGGTYYYDASDTTSVDNGGSVIVAADGARWKTFWFAETGIEPRVVSCYGDSFTMGLSGGIAYTESYPYLIAQAKNWNIPLPSDRTSPGVPSSPIGNLAFGGSQIASGEQIDRIMAHTTRDDDVQWILTGVNDSRRYGLAPSGLTTYKQTLEACLAWMAIPESSTEKLYADESDTAKVVRAGSGWVANTSWYNQKGYQTNVQNDTFSFTVFGDTVYLALPRDTSTTGLCSIVIDGVNHGTHDYSGSTFAQQYSRQYSMGFVRITGLTRSNHAVVLTKTSADTGTDYMRVDWVAGVVGAQGEPISLGGPQVYVGNCCRLSAAGYADGAPTWSNANDLVVNHYNKIIEQVTRDLAADGLNIALVDASKYYDPDTMQSFDIIHPDATGHQAIARAFLEVMDEQKVHPKDRGVIASIQEAVGLEPSTSSLGNIRTLGEIGRTTHVLGGGINTVVAYNLKILEGNYYRIDETKNTWLYSAGDSATGPQLLRKLPGIGQITSWDETHELVGGAEIAPSLLNSWANFGSSWKTASYARDSNGYVHLSGLVSSGTVGAAIFNLPVGYRPTGKVGFAVCANNFFAFLTVDAAGDVILSAGSNVFVTLDGVSFKAG